METKTAALGSAQPPPRRSVSDDDLGTLSSLLQSGARISHTEQRTVWARLANGAPKSISMQSRARQADVLVAFVAVLGPRDALCSDYALFCHNGTRAIDDEEVWYGGTRETAYALWPKADARGGWAPMRAAVARTVLKDMALSADVAAQRALTRLGPLLLNPLPLSTLDAAEGAPPVFAEELLQYVGSFKEYKDKVVVSNVGRNQKRHVVAVVQASGSGKSRLAFALGKRDALVVFVRIGKQHAGPTAGWETFGKLAQAWARQLGGCDADGRRAVAQFAMSALRLLVSCYVEWVAEIVHAVQCEAPFLDTRPPTEWDIDDPAAAQSREAALRCLRNGRGDAAVGQLFDAHLAEWSGSAELRRDDGSLCTVKSIDAVRVDAYCTAVDRKLRARLWRSAEIVISYDEVDRLFDPPFSLGVFQGYTDYVAERADGAEVQDCFYGLTALMVSLLDTVGWGQSMCGTWLRIAVADLATYSPLHGRVANEFHASTIKVEHMRASLAHYFDLGTDDADFEASLRLQLARLRGRPIFFFDCAWGALWAQLSRHSRAPQSSIDVKGLRALVLDAVRQGVEDARAKCASIVARLWDPMTASVVGAGGKSTTALCLELYAAARMHDGHVQLGHKDAAAVALRAGLLALPLKAPDDTALNLHLGDEPMMRDAIERRGDNAVRQAARDADDDPVLTLLHECVSTGSIAGFGLTTSVKGDIFELAFVWHVLRRVILAQGPVLLEDVLRPLVADGFVLPDIASTLTVHATRALPRDMLPRGDTDFHFLCGDDGARFVVYDVSTEAGADVIFGACSKRSAKNTSRAVLVQAKARKSASLRECLRYASPAWQYMRDTTDARNNVVTTPAPHREPFEALVQAYPRVFTRAVRVALSVNDFQPWTAPMIRGLNDVAPVCDSPVVLCTSSESAFGSRMHGRLRDECRGSDPTSCTFEFAYLLPHSVEVVRTGSAAKCPVPPAVQTIVDAAKDAQKAASASKGKLTRAKNKLAATES